MAKLLGICGLDCAGCGAYLATKNNDDALRVQTAAEWSEMFDADIKPEHINCTGCTAPGAKIQHCGECQVRLCGLARGLTSCGQCEDYSCETLDGFFKFLPPEAKANLDEIRTNR